MSKKCACGDGCNCSGGVSSLEISVEMGPGGSLPITLENLRQVTGIAYHKADNTITFMVEYLPGSGKTSYDVIDLHELRDFVVDFPEVGLGGLDLAKKLIELITDQPFVVDIDNKDFVFYRRQDFQGKIKQYEQTQENCREEKK